MLCQNVQFLQFTGRSELRKQTLEAAYGRKRESNVNIQVSQEHFSSQDYVDQLAWFDDMSQDLNMGFNVKSEFTNTERLLRSSPCSSNVLSGVIVDYLQHNFLS